MSQLAARHQAINLGQGFPDFDGDPLLHRYVTDAMAAGHNQYAPMAGVLALRQAIAEKSHALYGARYDSDSEITVTAGATQALMASILALVHPGDEVLVLEPAYDSYVPSIVLAGGIPIFVPLNAADDYAPDWARVRAAITPRTRLIIVNFPHNPSGRTLRPADLTALEEIVATTGVLLISDEVYEHIVFDGRAHISIASSPQLAARSVVISSFGKTFHVTGWKIGYACAPAALTAELRKVHQFMVFAVNTPAQHAIARYMSDPETYLRLPEFYQTKRDMFAAGLAKTRFRMLPCEGTFFMLAKYDDISSLPEAAFAQELVTRVGVAVIPLSGLYDSAQDDGVVRFCFAKKESTLQAALERLQQA